MGEKLFAGRVEIDADTIHTTRHHVVQALLERDLIDIVLILADPDRLWIDLDQFGQRIHQPAADRHRTAHRDILRWEFLASHGGSGIDRRARFVDHHHLYLPRQPATPDEGLGLTTGGAVADGDRFDLVLPAQRLQDRLGFGNPLPAGVGIDR